MGNYLIRTVKIRGNSGHYQGYAYNAYAFDYLATGDFKETFFNEYIVGIDDDSAVSIQFIVNTIVMAERQLHLNTWHVYVAVFDLAHYVSLDNDSGAFVMHPIGSNQPGIGLTLPEPQPSWGKRSSYQPDGSIIQTTLMEGPPNLEFGMLPSWSHDDDPHLYHRALTIARNVDIGETQKTMYFNCVGVEDCDITKKGTISLTGAGDLLATRYNRFKYYWRYVEPFITSYGIDTEGYLTYKAYALPGIVADYVSDMKSQQRVYMGKSLYARKSHMSVIKMMLECRQVLEIQRFHAEQGVYDTLELMKNEYMNVLYHGTIANHLSRMIHWFTYLINDIEIEEDIIGLQAFVQEEYLVPEFNYFTLKDIFNKMLAFYRWFDYFGENWYRGAYFQFGHGAWPENMKLQSGSIGNTSYMTTQLNTPDFIKARHKYYTDNFWTYHNNFIQYQSLIAKLERIWDVRSWDASLNVKPPKRDVPRTEYNGKYYSTRDGIESGISYPFGAKHGGQTDRQERNRYLVPDDMEPGPVTANATLEIYWGALEFSNLPIAPMRYPAVPPPVPSPPPAHKPYKWDNTIHPLTAEEQDAEVISLLEEIEENERYVLQNVWKVSKIVIEERGGDVPVGVDYAVQMGTDYIVDQINPTDRTKIRLPNTGLELDLDGNIPTTFDGPRIVVPGP